MSISAGELISMKSSINNLLSTIESIVESITVQTLIDIECKKLNIKLLFKAEKVVYKYSNAIIIIQ